MDHKDDKCRSERTGGGYKSPVKKYSELTNQGYCTHKEFNLFKSIDKEKRDLKKFHKKPGII